MPLCMLLTATMHAPALPLCLLECLRYDSFLIPMLSVKGAKLLLIGEPPALRDLPQVCIPSPTNLNAAEHCESSYGVLYKHEAWDEAPRNLDVSASLYATIVTLNRVPSPCAHSHVLNLNKQKRTKEADRVVSRLSLLSCCLDRTPARLLQARARASSSSDRLASFARRARATASAAASCPARMRLPTRTRATSRAPGPPICGPICARRTENMG